MSTQLTAFYYLPNTVDTSMLPVDICHLKQTVLIRSSTKCKYQSGQPQRRLRKTHYMRQNTVSSTLLARSCVLFSINVPVLPEMRQLQNKNEAKGFSIAVFVVWGPAHSWCGVWPKTAVMNVSLQQQMSIHNSWGLNLCLLKNCVWTISR